jgi:hypothetical protein
MKRHFLSMGLATLSLATLSLAAAPLAFAQDAPPTQDPTTTAAEPEETGKVTWSQLDTDGDGALSKTEAAAVDSLARDFDTADTNKDGSLTADEYKAHLGNQQTTPTTP